MEICVPYAIVICPQDGKFSAHVPDLPGCVAAGATAEEVQSEIYSAIAFHLEALRAEGLPRPKATARVHDLDGA
jgi:predicted RNase H-like HicB family nuclease